MSSNSDNKNNKEIKEIPFQLFTKDRILGKGGVGEVTLYDYRQTGSPDEKPKKRAIKIIQNYNQERFDKESRPLLQLEHDNIVKFFGKTDIAGFPALVLEYMEGGNLSDVIYHKTSNPGNDSYKLGDILRWLCQAAGALEFMHTSKLNNQKGFIHRDVKPQNFLLDSLNYRTANLKICDFGDSKILENSRNTQNKGTPYYMAPEVLEGRSYIETCDVYSWTLTFWECLTGVTPFRECKNLTELGLKKKVPNYLMYINNASDHFNKIIRVCSSIDIPGEEELRSRNRLPMTSLKCLLANMLLNKAPIETIQNENFVKENICVWNRLTGEFYHCEGLMFNPSKWKLLDDNPLLIQAALDDLSVVKR